MAKKDFNLGDLARTLAEEGVSNLNTTVEDIQSIPLEKISANAGNFYDKSDIEELASSIELTGLIHPIVVKEDGQGGYIIIDGERRYTAMAQLGHETVPAIVRRPVNDVLEELMLIEANRTQRKMSAADIAVQAERYTELLAKLKESGVEIPGRLRDRVAEAMQISSAKLARLHAIMENLKEPYLGEFKSGTINESVAYELSKLTPERQKLVGGRSAKKLTADSVTSYAKYADRCYKERECPFGGTCEHSKAMFQKGKDSYEWSKCISSHSNRNGCCKTCPDRLNCKKVCPKATPGVLKEQMKEANKKAKQEAKDEEKRLVAKAEADADWARVKAIRERAGVPLDSPKLSRIWGMYSYYEKRSNPSEWDAVRGLAKQISMYQLVPLAQLFQVSVDELLGLETPERPGGLDWKDGNVELPEGYNGPTVATWGDQGLKAVKVLDYPLYLESWPETYHWWAYVNGPEEVEGHDKA